MRAPTMPDNGTEERAYAQLDEAAARAAAGDPAGAGTLAVAAAALLVDRDRQDALVLGARLLGRAGRHSDAATAWGDAARFAPDDDQRAGALSARGEAARLAGRWAEAEAAQREALALADRVFGPGSRKAAAVAHNLAVTYKYTGRFDEAEALYQRALAAATDAGDTAFLAVICHNIGGLAHARGAPAHGEPWARRAVELREAGGDDPLALAADRGALAAVLIGLGRHEEAEQLLEQAAHTFTAMLGPDHHEVGVVAGNLAALALARGELDVAEVHARRALAIKAAALGSANPELAPTLTTLGTIRRRRGDQAEAVALHRRALDLLESAVEPSHPLLATVRANLATAAGKRPPPDTM